MGIHAQKKWLTHLICILSGDEIQIQSMGDALVISRKHAQLIVNGTDQPIQLEIKGITHHLDACTYVVNSFEQRKESIP